MEVTPEQIEQIIALLGWIKCYLGWMLFLLILLVLKS